MYPKKLINYSLFYNISIFAITFTIASPILIEISKSINRNISAVGLLFTLFSSGFVLGSLLVGLLSKFFAKESILNITLILQTLFLITFSFSKTYIFVLIVIFMIGMCGGLSETLTSILFVLINKGREGYYLNISQVYFGIGAFIGPYISSTIAKLGLNWNISYYIVAFLALINFILFTFVKFKYRSIITPDILNERESNIIYIKNKSIKWTPAMITILLLMVLAMFMYAASEDGLNAWIPTFFRLERNLTYYGASQILSFYWLAIAGGRIIVGFLSDRFNLFKLTIIISIFGLLFASAGLIVKNQYANLILFLIAGLFYSGIWPNIVAITSKYFNKNRETAISIIISFGGVGALFAPWIVGVIYKNYNLFIGLMICILFLFIETIMIFVIYILTLKVRVKEKIQQIQD